MTENYLSNLAGLFATPTAENPTVVIMEAAFRHHDLDWKYLNCDVSPDNLGDAVRGARAMGWAGFNCSQPHKVAVIEHLDGLADSAKIIGAVNTVVRRNGLYIGENTDGLGFLKSIASKMDPAGKNVLMFGAGGAARAVAVELALAGAARVDIVNRSVGRGEELVALLNADTSATARYHNWSADFAIPETTDIVINMTPIGLFPKVDDELDVDFTTLKSHMLVVDAITNPPETRLIQTARNKGCGTLDGLGIVVNVIGICLEMWTGVDVDRRVMLQAVADLNA
ncbi:MAG: shikimate dehydrogenase [Alphaproteobacteria bacterium]|nr:shikimate dehydrogenase [Alphaproteobacteria bacterium]